MSTPERPPGFSLIETVVATALVGMLLGVLVMLLVRTSNLVTRSTVLNELQNSGEGLYRRMAVLCNQSDAGGASYSSGNNECLLALHPIESITPSARKLYAAHVTLFAWDSGNSRLLMFEGDSLPESNRYDPSRLDLEAMRALSRRAHPKILADRVTDCQLTSVTGNSWPLRLKIRLEQPVPHGPAQVYLLERSLCLRNFF